MQSLLARRLLGGSPARATHAAAEPAGTARSRAVERKDHREQEKEFVELMQALGQLAASYARMPPAGLQKFAQNAGVGQGEGPLQGTVQIRSETCYRPAI